MVKIEFNTNTINGSLQKEKKEAIAFVERRLNDLNLDYKWIEPEKNGIAFVTEILGKYWNNDDWVNSYRVEMANDFNRLISSQGWFESISQSQDQKTIKEIGEFIGKVIVNFAAKENNKFQEITATLNELESELKKAKPDENRVNYLKNKIEKFNSNTDKGFSYPVAANFIQTNLLEKEKKNQENIQPKDNSLYEGNHDTIRKYKELAAKIFDNYNDRKNRVMKKEYENIDVQLSQEIARGDWNLEDFWDTSDSYISESYRKQLEQKNQIELRNRERLIEKMEQLIAKVEQGNNDKKRKNEESNNDLPESKRLKGEEIEKSKNEITKKINNEQDEVKNEISNSLQGIESKSSEEQEKELEKIEKQNNGQKAYQEQKEKVDKLKDKLAEKDPQKYGELAARNIAKRISAAGALILDEKTQEKLENLKNGKITDAVQVRKTEEEVNHQVNLAIATKKLNELLTEIEKLGKNEKAKEKGSDLFEYISDANTYHQQVYQINKSRVDKILVEQGFIQASSKTDAPSGFFQPKVIAPLALAMMTAALVAIVVIRNKKQKRTKKF